MKAWLAAVAFGAAAAAWAGAGSNRTWPALAAPDAHAARADAFPDSASALRRLIGAQIEAGDHRGARLSLRKLGAMGFALSPAGQQQLGELIDPALTAQFAANATEFGHAHEIAQIPASFGLIESVVRVGGRWVASGITAQDLLVSTNGKSWKRLGLTGMASFSGLAVVERRGLVWAASAVFEPTPQPEGAFSGLILVDPRTGRVVRRVIAPPGVVPSDITVASDGTVYASDPLNGGVWLARPRSAALETLVPPGRFRSPQGLVLSANERALYISDYPHGLAVIDLASGRIDRLTGPRPLMLDGIDGLFRRGHSLIAVQNGTRPIRILALDLTPDGRSIGRLRVLQSRRLGAGEPTTGQLVGSNLVHVSNARWDLYGAKGAPVEGGQTAPTIVAGLRVVETR